MWQVWVWERIMEQNSNKIFDTIDVRKSLQIITDTMLTGPELLQTPNTVMSCQAVKEKIRLISCGRLELE